MSSGSHGGSYIVNATAIKIDLLPFLMPKDEVRKLRSTDVIPKELDAGFEQLGMIDREWVWVLANEHRVKGIIVAAPVHGTVFVWRVALIPGQKSSALSRLLRGFLQSMREIGCAGILTIVDAKVPTQRQFRRVLERIKGKKFGEYDLVVAPMPKEFI